MKILIMNSTEERTLVILKPEVLENCIISAVFKFYEDAGLKPVAMKQLKPSREHMREHYADLVGRYSPTLIEEILDRMTRGDCIFIVFQGIDVIRKVRLINGATDPKKAEEGTIRKTLASGINYNLVHGSDSVESAAKEIALWFGPDF